MLKAKRMTATDLCVHWLSNARTFNLRNVATRNGMTHLVDGFGLKFTSRTSWKAQRYEFGSKIDVIPVTWTKGLQAK